MGALSLILISVAAGLSLVFWRMLNPPPQLQITDRGILDRRLSLGWLEWQAIDGAYRSRRADGDRLLLQVSVDERLRRRLARRWGKGPLPERLELSLDLGGTPYSEVEVLHEIMAHSQAAAAAESRPSPGVQATRLPCR